MWATLRENHNMGDRTSVNLEILNVHVEAFKEIDTDYDETCPGAFDTTCFHYYEVNYGELDFLDELEKKGIPYDSQWGSGGSYSSGTVYCRFTPEGECEIKEVYDDCINPELDKCLSLINSPDELIKYILDFKKEITPLSWENQAEYGKRYLAKKLISSN